MTETKEISAFDQFSAVEEAVGQAYNFHVDRSSRDTISLDPFDKVPLDQYDSLKQDYQQHVALWEEQGIDVSKIIRATLIVATATEENLPWYTAEIIRCFEPIYEWDRRWVTEERSHGKILERAIEARGILDMSREWHPIVEKNMEAGIHVKLQCPAEGFAYVTVQELLTRMAHFGAARILDKKGKQNLMEIGGDEGRHYRFYITAFKALAQAYPDLSLAAMRSQHQNDAFSMPGEQGIQGFRRMALTMALGGIFDPLTVLEAQRQTILDAELLEIKPQTEQGRLDQEWAATIVDRESDVWRAKRSGLAEVRERMVARTRPGRLSPFVLGHTVELNGNNYLAIAS